MMLPSYKSNQGIDIFLAILVVLTLARVATVAKVVSP
jgi:hypothetical protein